MKKLPSIRVIIMTTIAIMLVNIVFSFDFDQVEKQLLNLNSIQDFVEVEATRVAIGEEITDHIDYKELYPEIVYEGMNLKQLGEKLEGNLKSTLSGYGYTIASYAIEYEVDPYLALAIMLHETGCNSGSCSALTKKCNNIGGIKGGPTCGNGSYKRFDTLEEGIEFFMRNLSKNYIQQGLTTPEQINRKYATSTTWAEQVKYYITQIRNS